MGNTPSLRASIQKGRWDVVDSVLGTEDGRDRARSKTYVVSKETVTALQLACRYRAPTGIIQSLTQIGQPLPASTPSQLTPLHYAMMTRPATSPQVVSTLLTAFPGDVAKCSSPYRQTPLHMACEGRVSPEIIQLLHETDPNAARIRDARGRTAWDVARTHWWIMHPIWRGKVKKILLKPVTRVPTNNRSQRVVVEATPVPNNRPQRVVVEATPVPNVPVPAPQPGVVVVKTTPVPNIPRPEPVARPVPGTIHIPVAAVAETIASGLTGPMIPTAPPDTMLEEDVCLLCFDRRADMALIPCGHLCLCSQCCDPQTLNEFLHRKCPVCRQLFREPLRIYQAGISGD